MLKRKLELMKPPEASLEKRLLHKPTRWLRIHFSRPRPAPFGVRVPEPAIPAMSITHCPLCVGLALLSAVRFMGHAVLVWTLGEPQPAVPRPLQPAAVQG